MKKISVVLQNESGLHARPAKKFVSIASKFASDILISKDCIGPSVNGKSILMVLSLGAIKGTKLQIMVTGEDEEEATKALDELFMNNLYEE